MRDGPPPASLARVLARAGRPAVPSSSRPFEVVELTAPPVDAPDPGGAPPPGRATLDPPRDAPPGTRSEMPEPPRAPRPEAPRRPVPPVSRVTPRDRADDLGPPSDVHPLGEPSPPAPPPVVIERIDITTPPATAGASDPLAPLSGRRRGRTHHPRPQAR